MDNLVEYDGHTGLLFFKEIPFTKERIKGLKTLLAVNQFDISISITDKACDLTASFNTEEIKLLVETAEEKGYNKIASDKDFL